MHQVVNLRTSYAIAFGDDESQERYEQECEQARAAQAVRYAVAPRQVAVLPDGRTLQPGTEVRLEDFHGGQLPAWEALERLVRRGCVLEATNPPLEAA